MIIPDIMPKESQKQSIDHNNLKLFKNASLLNASNASKSKGSKRRKKKHFKTADGKTFIESSIYKKN